MNKKCPFCSELIKKDAKKCRYCGEWLIEKQIIKPIKTHSWLNKYYLIWISSILAFFGTFVLSVNSLISDNITLLTIGIFAIIGVLSFIKLLRIIISPSARTNRTKYIVLIITGFALFLILAKINPPVFRSSDNEAGLRKTVEEQYKLAANPDEKGLRELYENYLSSSFKNSITEDKYVSDALSSNQSEGIQTSRYEINGITMDGTEGYVDRTAYLCADTSCSNIKSKSRIFRKYVYENQRWLMTEMPTFCPRKQMYNMEPEFSRALSLISQRFSKDITDAELLESFNEILNCVDIKYADSENAIGDAEGLFQFVPGQSTERLTILVSPRYKIQDDLVTATLLTHEYSHALVYVGGLNTGQAVDCFLNEAIAFREQNQFISILNNEERQSMLARLVTNPSPELKGISNTWVAINASRGSTYEEKTLNFVKSDPFYQKECSGR